MKEQQPTTTAGVRVDGVARRSEMHEARRRKAQELEEKLAMIRTSRESSGLGVIVAGGVTLALIAFVVIKMLKVLA